MKETNEILDTNF